MVEVHHAGAVGDDEGHMAHGMYRVRKATPLRIAGGGTIRNVLIRYLIDDDPAKQRMRAVVI
jgi:hypothetical protein